MPRLLLATHNRHKTTEFANLMGSHFEVHDLTGLKHTVPVPETGATFAENATLKALAASQMSSELVVADDSGLKVEALDGAPGIFSARYAGAGATDTANVTKLLRDLEATHLGPTRRQARFVCVLAVAQRGKLLQLFCGEVAGTISSATLGTAGFGYDPVFVPSGFTRSFAEMTAAEKNAISHRARATRALREWLMTRGAAADYGGGIAPAAPVGDAGLI